MLSGEQGARGSPGQHTVALETCPPAGVALQASSGELPLAGTQQCMVGTRRDPTWSSPALVGVNTHPLGLQNPVATLALPLACSHSLRIYGYALR